MNMKKYEWLWTDMNGEIRGRCWVRLDKEEADLLIKYCKLAKIGIVEIGRKHGGSTYLIADSSTVPIISIDKTPEHLDNCRQPRLKQELEAFIKTKRLTLINKKSEDVKLTNKYDILFIDGNHNKGLSRDVNNYWSNLTKYAIFHDYGDDCGKIRVKEGIDCLIENKCCKMLVQKKSMIVVEKLKNFKSFKYPDIIEL